VIWFFYFFFQAEDGIRDFHVTGVQMCALPISLDLPADEPAQCRKRVPAALGVLGSGRAAPLGAAYAGVPMRAERPGAPPLLPVRSEERRVGKECRSRVSTDHQDNSTEYESSVE